MAIDTGPRLPPYTSSIRHLHRLTQAVATARGLDGIYSAALNCLSESLGVERASVLIFDTDGVMRFKAWLGISEEYRRTVEGHTPWTPEEVDPQPILLPDVYEDGSLAEYYPAFRREEITALAFIPLVAEGRLLGKFMLYYPEPHDFSEDELLLAQTIASQVAFAIDQHNAHSELRKRQQQYEQLVESLGVAVYTTDAEGRVALYNQAAVDLWGRRPVIGEDMWCGSWRIYGGDGEKIPLDECPMAVALKENRPVRGIEIVIERPDGTSVRAAPYPTPLRDPEGNVTGAVNVIVDITDRKKAESDLTLYREIFENSQEGIAIVDPLGYYREQNRAHERLIGYATEELEGQTPAVHLGDEGFKVVAEALQRDGAFRGEATSVTRDGRSLVLELSAFSVRDDTGEVRYHVGIKRDITERKRAEEAIKRSMEVKDQFLGLVSHELRTPISTILGNGLLLQGREHLIGEDDRRNAYADIVAEARKLQENVEHLLLLTKLESGDLELQPLSLASLVRQCVDDFARQHPDRKVTLNAEDGVPPVAGQETLVTLVLQNLLSNAAKYSSPHSDVEVHLSMSGTGQPRLLVRDYGIGLDDQDMEGLFTAFYRSNRARNHATGMGLGLAVCKRALEAQGGSIGARPAAGGGSEFFFYLPVVTPDDG